MKREQKPLLWGGFAVLIAAAAWAGSLTTDNLTVNQASSFSGAVTIGHAALSTNAVPTNGFVLFYSLDTSTSTVVDASGNGNNGTVGSGATWTNGGQVAGAYRFDGTANAYIQAADSASLDITNAFTVSAWVKLDTVSGLYQLVGKHDDGSDRAYDIHIESGLLWWLVSRSGASGNRYQIATTGIVVSTNWSHLVCTWDGTPNTNAQIYCNGVIQDVDVYATSFSGTTIHNSSQPLRVGSKSNGGWNFAGMIDDVRIYNFGLSAGQVLALYEAQASAITQLLTVAASATFSGTTTITRLVKQGDIDMGIYTNGP